jgi:chitosanase
MPSKYHLRQLALAMGLLNPALGQTVVGSDYNNPSAGPPGSYFAAATTMPVAAVASIVANASVVPQSAKYPIHDSGNSPTATIYADFASLSTVSTF